MKDCIIFNTILNSYISTQSSRDRLVLKLFVFEGVHELYRLAHMTGRTRMQVNKVVAGLKSHLEQAGYI